MNRKTKYLACVVISMLLCATAYAKPEESQSSYRGIITITPNGLSQQGDSLYVSIDFKMSGVNIDSRNSADFIPVLVSPAQSKKLPMVSIKGRNNYKNYKRQQALMNKHKKAYYDQPACYQVIKGFEGNSQEIHYHYAMLYETWMDDARLDLQKNDGGCGMVNILSVQQLMYNVSTGSTAVIGTNGNITSVIETDGMAPSLVYVQPPVEMVKHRDMETEILIDFTVRNTAINSNYRDNSAELGKIRKMIDCLKADVNIIEVKSIKIVGYASPEGSLAQNRLLSEGRANALKNRLSRLYDFPENIYHVDFGGENWDGLIKILDAGDYTYKDNVLDIIESTPIENGREKKIMDLEGGVPYRQMLQYIFPQLRKAICKVDYNIRNFTAEEARKVIKIAPQDLSLSEIYSVAQLCGQGTQEFIDALETAVRIYPDDETANLNIATVALSRKDLVTAKNYLDKIKDRVHHPEYNNSYGVLEMLQGNYDKAEEYLKAARQAGVQEAQNNLNEISRLSKNK